MFEVSADQADGLRRLFSRAQPMVLPLGCCALAAQCRGYAATVGDRLERAGFSPLLFDRLDLAHDLGEVQTHPPVDRLLLLDEPLRLGRWLKDRQSAMLLLLSHKREALPSHYAAIKAIATAHGPRRFGTCFVDARNAEEDEGAHRRLASCVERFLDVEIERLPRNWSGNTSVTAASLARLQCFAIPIRAFSPSEAIPPVGGSRRPH